MLQPPTKLTLLVALAAATAAAQSDWVKVKALPIGQEIRASLRDGKSYRGQVQNVTDEALVMVAASQQQTLARAEVKKIATKSEGHRLRNALIGAGLGAAGGVGFGAAIDASCSPHCLGGNNTGKFVFTPVGAIVGAVVGVAWPTGTWHTVYKSN